MSPKNLILIRHAESEGNRAERAFVESGDTGFFSDELLSKSVDDWQLTELGEQQASCAGEWLSQNILRYSNNPHFLVSPTIRAISSAKLLVPDGSWNTSHLIKERSFGQISHLPEEIQRKYYGKATHVDLSYFGNAEIDGVESMQSVLMRTVELLNFLNNCENDTVVVVTHGYLIHAARLVIEQIDPQLLPSVVGDRWVRYCQICHYSRQDPYDSAEMCERLSWLKETCNWVTNKIDHPWRRLGVK